MYSKEKYNTLLSKYGCYSSWAIWNNKRENDTSVISNNLINLHSNFVFLGLNIAKTLIDEKWINFHGGKHDRKLKYACSGNILAGSYLTDIFKGVSEAKSSKMVDLLTPEIIESNVNLFKQEMKDIGVDDNTVFIVCGVKGSILANNFDRYFKLNFNNTVIYHYHYSYYGISDKKWVTSLWDKLDINQDFVETLKRFKKFD